jgi:8-oxo-dGTP diphosphatase
VIRLEEVITNSREAKFVYKKEFWLMSAFINVKEIRIKTKISEIKTVLLKKLKNLKEKDLGKISWNPDWQKKVIEMGKNISLECSWIPFIEHFPYYDENTGVNFDTLGYFEFEVEYYRNNAEEKEMIEPVLIQQIPSLIKEELSQYSDLIKNRYFFIDKESPVYDFVTSDTVKPDEIEWTEDNIKKYKHILGNWTEIYSGSWPDYNDELYNKRIQNNLSNRLSELHFIRRNSAFIYMKPENFKLHFEGYMKEYVLKPIPQIRALVFALMEINSSLDILGSIASNYLDIDTIEDKIKNLRHLRGMIQTKMSIIHNELDYNRRQHYTAVLEYLIREFNLNEILNRINNKFDVIYDTMNLLYQKQNDENQERSEKSMNLLNILFSLGILADFSGLLIGTIEGWTDNFLFLLINGISAFVILAMFIYTMISRMKLKAQTTRKISRNTVDAVILDGRGNVVLITRKFPPFKDQLALPGGFIEGGESEKEALIREVKEETGLDVKVGKTIGLYDKKGRDPRGSIISKAYLCSIIGRADDITLKGMDDAKEAKFVSLEKIKELDLAFDHEDILRDGLKMA